MKITKSQLKQIIKEELNGVLQEDGCPIQEEEELDERCQKGYKTHQTRKTKKMYGKTYRNCVKAEDKKPTKLTKGEIEKRKEIADAIKEKNPGISDDKKFAFATATVKKMRKK